MDLALGLVVLGKMLGLHFLELPSKLTNMAMENQPIFHGIYQVFHGNLLLDQGFRRLLSAANLGGCPPFLPLKTMVTTRMMT